jgi:predicted transcriptional regulator
MSVMAPQTQLRTLRESLGEPYVTQEAVARCANLPLSTYRNAEGGKPVSYATAAAILGAINEIRKERNMQPLHMEELGLR